jgi:hypothetical protein
VRKEIEKPLIVPKSKARNVLAMAYIVDLANKGVA